MSIKRGLLIIFSLYSLAFIAIPAFMPLLGGEPITFRSPWFQPISLFVFVAAWALLWQDLGAVDERHRQRSPAMTTNKPESFDEIVDICAEKILKKLMRGDMRDGVVDAVHVVISWQRQIREQHQEKSRDQ